MRWHLALLPLLLLAGPGPAATLTGTVQRVGGGARHDLGLDSARVELTPLGAGSRVLARCDHSGRFRLEELPAGDWELALSDGQGAGARCFVTLPEGGTVTVQLRLASPAQTAVFTLLWLLVAVSITGACGAGIILYGTGRGPHRSSAPHSLTVALLLWCLAFLMLELLSPAAQPMSADLAQGLSALLAALLGGCVVLTITELKPPWQAALAALASGLLLSVAARAGLRGNAESLGIGVGLLLWTTAAGWLLSLWLRRPSYLVLAALVIAVADTWSVFYGFTRAVVTSDQAPAQALLSIGVLPWPILGSSLVTGVIGVGDFLFLAWFLSAARRFELGVSRNFWLLMGGFTVGITVAQVLQLVGVLSVGLPALPFLSALFLLGNRGRFALSRDERRQILRALVVLVVVLGVSAAFTTARSRRQAGETAGARSAAQPAFHGPWNPAELARLAVDCQRGEAQDGCAAVRLTTHLADGRQLVSAGHWARPTAADGAPAVLCLLADEATDTAKVAGVLAQAGWEALVLPWAPASPTRRSPFDVTPNAVSSPLYEAGVQAWAAAAQLRGEAGATRRLALVGEGWGGLVALAAAGWGRPTAVVALGCGTVTNTWSRAGAELAQRTARSRQEWASFYAPERFAAQVRCPALVVGATNDATFGLPAIVELHQALGGRRGLWLAPNAARVTLVERLPEVADWLRLAARGGSGLPEAPPLNVTTADDDLVLRADEPGPTTTTSLTWWISAGPPGWPGRYWQAVPAQRGADGWSTKLAVSAPGGTIAVMAQKHTPAGQQCSPVRWFAPADIGLTLSVAPWPRIFVAAFEDGLDGWRVAEGSWRETGIDLFWEAPREVRLIRPAAHTGPGAVVLETNYVEVLRRLGSQAAGIELELAPRGAAGEVRLEVVERFGQADERRFAGSQALSGDARAVLRWPLARLRGEQPAARPDWSLVDGLRLTVPVAGEATPVLHALRLYGPPGGEVRKVTER